MISIQHGSNSRRKQRFLKSMLFCCSRTKHLKELFTQLYVTLHYKSAALLYTENISSTSTDKQAKQWYKIHKVYKAMFTGYCYQ